MNCDLSLIERNRLIHFFVICSFRLIGCAICDRLNERVSTNWNSTQSAATAASVSSNSFQFIPKCSVCSVSPTEPTRCLWADFLIPLYCYAAASMYVTAAWVNSSLACFEIDGSFIHLFAFFFPAQTFDQTKCDKQNNQIKSCNEFVNNTRINLIFPPFSLSLSLSPPPSLHYSFVFFGMRGLPPNFFPLFSRKLLVFQKTKNANEQNDSENRVRALVCIVQHTNYILLELTNKWQELSQISQWISSYRSIVKNYSFRLYGTNVCSQSQQSAGALELWTRC